MLGLFLAATAGLAPRRSTLSTGGEAALGDLTAAGLRIRTLDASRCLGSH